MMKKRWLFLLGLLTGCASENIKPGDVISNLTISNHSPLADGITIIDLSVKLNPDADDDKRNIVFSAGDGMFLVSKDTVITQKAQFENGNLIARVKFQIPAKSEKIIFTVLPEIRSQYHDFLLRDSITTIESLPTSIKISPSAFSVYADFAGDVQITGVLKNGGSGVTAGAKVVFEDFDLATHDSINGRYRQTKSSSDATSSVSTYYSPGFIPVGTTIIVKCTILDNNGQKTTKSDSCLISVINHP